MNNGPRSVYSPEPSGPRKTTLSPMSLDRKSSVTVEIKSPKSILKPKKTASDHDTTQRKRKTTPSPGKIDQESLPIIDIRTPTPAEINLAQMTDKTDKTVPINRNKSLLRSLVTEQHSYNTCGETLENNYGSTSPRMLKGGPHKSSTSSFVIFRQQTDDY